MAALPACLGLAHPWSAEKRGFLPARRGPPCLLLSSRFHHGPEWGLCLGVSGDTPGSGGAACGTGLSSPPRPLCPAPSRSCPSPGLVSLPAAPASLGSSQVSATPHPAPLHLLFPLPAGSSQYPHGPAPRGFRAHILGGTFSDLPAVSLPCFLFSIACIWPTAPCVQLFMHRLLLPCPCPCPGRLSQARPLWVLLARPTRVPG